MKRRAGAEIESITRLFYVKRKPVNIWKEDGVGFFLFCLFCEKCDSTILSFF